MKMTVILAVLFVSLLVMTGAVFAAPTCCVDTCYKVSGTDLTNPANSFTQDWEFCGDNLVVCNMSGPTFLFQFLPFPEIFPAGHTISFNSTQGAYIKFITNNTDTFNGLYYNGVDQFRIHGVQERCPL